MTFDDDDGVGNGPDGRSTELAVFIAGTRLSKVLEALLPLLLERQSSCRSLSDRSVMRQAATELENVYRDLPPDLMFDKASRFSTRPGVRALQLSHIGLEILFCRLGLDQDDFSTLSSLIYSSRLALRPIETLIAFLETLGDVDYHEPWTPWSPAQMTNAAALLLRQALKIHQFKTGGSEPSLGYALSEREEHERIRTIADITDVLARLLALVQGHSQRGWEIASSSLSKIAGLVKSNIASTIPGIQGAQMALDSTGDWPNAGEFGNYIAAPMSS